MTAAIRAAMLFLLVTLSLGPGGSTFARADTERLALVIGVSDYESLPKLKNTVNDAKLIAATLEKIGFDVTLVENPSGSDLKRSIRDYGKLIKEANQPLSVVYYAGQGLQYRGDGFMIGADAKIASEEDLDIDAVNLNQAIEKIASANTAGASLFFFDACRDDPFAGARRGSTRGAAVLSDDEDDSGAGRGLTPPEIVAPNLAVMYAAEPGGVAMDGTGDNGPFALALAKALSTPNATHNQLFRLIRNDVLTATEGRQKPWAQDSMRSELVLNEADEIEAPDAKQKLLTRAAQAVYEPEPGELVETYLDGSYALLVGVSDYDPPGNTQPQAWDELPAVGGELDRIAKVLTDVHGFDVERVNNPTADELKAAIDSFVNRHGRKTNARLVIMMSGHGTTSELYGKKVGWFVPRDAPSKRDGLAPFASKALSLRRVEEWSEIIEAKHVLWLFDSCFSGNALRMAISKGETEPDAWSADLHSKPVRRVITAGSEDEVVPGESHFSGRLVDILSGKKRVGDGDAIVTGEEIGAFLKKDVVEFTAKHGLRPQHPQSDTIVIQGDEGDIVFRLEDKLVQAWRD